MLFRSRNRVFEGGGVKGIAYVGAMEALAERGIVDAIERVGGTSAGAINAVLVGLGYTPQETRDILWGLDFRNFMDDSWGLVRDTDRLLHEFGWYKGDFFRGWIAQLIGERTGNTESTFDDLEAMKASRGFKSLYFMGTNLSTRFSEVFSAEHTPRMCVADAVRISMSIPLFFAARRSVRGDVYVDGGVLDNYPVKLFDRRKYTDRCIETPYYAAINRSLENRPRELSPYVYNKETLGFRLDTREEISVFRDHAEPPREAVEGFFDYAWALVRTVLESQQSTHLHDDDWQRTIYIDSLGVGTTDFDLGDDRKHALLESGKAGVRNYFAWFDTPGSNPVNR